MLLALILAAMIIVGLLWNGRIELSLCIYQSGFRLELTVLFFYAFLRIHIALRAEWSLVEGVRVFLIRRNGRLTRIGEHRTQKALNRVWIRRLLSIVKTGFVTKRVAAEGILGIEDDAFACVMLTGALQSVLNLLFLLISGDRAKEACVSIKPIFTANVFRLNLEGIFAVRTANIIIAVCRQFHKPKGVFRNATPD